MSNYIAKKPDSAGRIHFTDEENETWSILIKRQKKTVEDRACDEFLQGLEKLALPESHIPQCVDVSKTLTQVTGWSVVPVDAMIPLKEFFRLLAHRKFPAASFIRKREELDYLKEPDIFHELFGHCPLLMHQAYADFIEWYGNTALKVDREVQSILGRLFWFTIEFGLMQTSKGLRIYGGGILSSQEETVYALESPSPERLAFDAITVLLNDYRYNEIQNRYFIIENLSALFELKSEKILTRAEKIAEKTIQESDFILC